jgi:hypothetical protein
MMIVGHQSQIKCYVSGSLGGVCDEDVLKTDHLLPILQLLRSKMHRCYPNLEREMDTVTDLRNTTRKVTKYGARPIEVIVWRTTWVLGGIWWCGLVCKRNLAHEMNCV